MNNEDLRLSIHCVCTPIFTWAHYRPHTIYHLTRFPLIGDWNAWQRLNERLDVILQGKIPEETSDEKNEHVLDVILYQKQEPSSINLVETDMYTIVFVSPLLPMSSADERSWKETLEQINGSIVSIDCTKPVEEEAADDQNITNGNVPSECITFAGVKPKFSIVHLLKSEHTTPDKIDVLDTIFRSIHNVLSDYQEKNVRTMMQQYGALTYNKDLLRNDPPDGYYLCNTECLEKLKNSFRCAPHTLATTSIFDSELLGDQYVLLVVEVKLSFDALRAKLAKENYYILKQARHPIRNLVIVNGGQVTLTWLFLINLAHVDTTNRQTRIDQQIRGRSYEMAMRIRKSHTHIVYIPSFSSETFRQEPLERERLSIMCKLDELQQEVDKYSKSIAGVSGLEKLGLDYIRNEKRLSYSKEMFNLIDEFVKKYPIRAQRSVINFSILLQAETYTETSFGFLEQLAMSLVKEVYRNVWKTNQHVRLPRQLVKRARQLCRVKPFSSVEVPTVRTRIASAREVLFPDDDDMQFGQQPI